MRMTPFRYQLAACATAVLLSACGGGDASAPGSGSSASSGFAVDGYLSGATVLCDTNNNGAADSGERTITTDSSGFFQFSPACASALVATGGTSIDTGLVFTGTLKAPSGATVITPLTTLIANGGSQSAINSALGLAADTNLLTTDPARTQVGSNTLVNADLMKKTLVIQQFAQKITEMIAGLATSGGDAARPAIYGEVMAALAQALAANPALISGGAISESSAQALIKAAVQRVAASSALASGVKVGVAALNADSLAQVMAGALKVQGETILGATGETLTAKTKTAQENTAITVFIQTNRANLTGAPSTATANLATSLKDQVSGNTTPPSTNGDTDLLNFDNLLPVASFGAEGGEGSGLVAAPAGGGSGQAYRVLRSGGQTYALAVLEKALPFTADRKTISAQVFSPIAGIPMAMKVEAGDIGIEVQANQQVVQGWQTLTWTFTGVNTALNFNKIVLLPRLGTVDAPPGQSYYFDNIKLLAAVTVTPPASNDTELLNFDSSLPVSAVGGEGGEGSGLVAAPAGGGSGQAYRVLRSGGQTYALAILEKVVPFTADRKTISAQVYSPLAGIPMVVKMETASGANTGDVQANQTVVVGWQTLTWTFTSANPALTYNKIVLLPRLGTVDAPPGQSYYFDNIKLLAGSGTNSGGGDSSTLPITFDSASVSYSFTPFEGASNAGRVADPAGGSNMVGKVERAAGGPWYGGVTVSTGANNSIATIPFTANAKTMTMRFYSPAAGVRVRMKVENATDAGVSTETDAVSTGIGWETLSFNFNNPGLAPPVTGGPTAALNVAQTYNKVTLFFNVAAANGAWGGTYYFDTISFGAP